MLSFSEGSPILGDARLHLRPRKPLRSFQGLICLTINSPVLQKLCLVPSEPFKISSWPFHCLQSDTENVPLFNATLDWTCSSIVHCTASLYHIIPCVYIILTPKTLVFFMCTFLCGMAQVMNEIHLVYRQALSNIIYYFSVSIEPYN